MHIYDCDAIPDGPLVIIHSQDMFIKFLDTKIQLLSEQERSNAQIVAMNYFQDQYAFENYHMSYEQYMDRVILSLIERLKNVTNNTNNIVQEDLSIPYYFEAQTGYKLDKNVTDVNVKNKTRGFLNLEATNFQFIGPDRDLIEYKDIDHVCKLAKIIQSTGLPNYKMARFPINLPAWEHYLKDYPDQRLFQYFQYYDPDVLHNTDINNHFSALQYPTAVQEYLDKEKSLGAMLGPVNRVNYPGFHCSPLLTRPKDIDKRRVILNLSYPHGCSLNDNVDKLYFDGKRFALKFPSIDDIVHEFSKYSIEVLISKIHISRAFRNLRVDPADAIKFGIKWKDAFFLDVVAAFSWVHGSSSFQLAADAITYITERHGFKTFAYIDDFILVTEKNIANQAFHILFNLFEELGLPMNRDKRTTPTHKLTCLGITIDLHENTLSIDPLKLGGIYMDCIKVLHKKFISKRALQSLSGKLLYLHKCVKPARTFVNRILTVFRKHQDKSKILISEEFRQDVKWFTTFLPHFNGITILKKEPIRDSNTLHIDASLTGLGGVWGHRVYSTPIYPISDFELKIVHLEMFNILLSLRTWGDFWQHSTVSLFCDNLAVVQVVETSKTKDPFLAACIRNIWLITAALDINLEVSHIRGADNHIADLLSRLYSQKFVNNSLYTDLQTNYSPNISL